MLRAKAAGIKTLGSGFVRVFFNPDGSPVKRKNPKKRMSKKERRKARKAGTVQYGPGG
jgi:hypothetical protein